MKAERQWQLVVTRDQTELLRVRLWPGQLRVGRGPRAEISLGELEGELEVLGDAVVLHALGEANMVSVTPFQSGGICFVARPLEAARSFLGSTQSMPAPPSAQSHLRISAIGDARAPIILERGQLKMGKDDTNDVVLSSTYASTFHCAIYAKADGWWARDLGSKNGTFLDDVKIGDARLSPPTVLKVGDQAFRIDLKSAADDLGPRLIGESPAAVKLAKAISKLATSREPLIVIGPSGAGKKHAARALHAVSTPRGPFVVLSSETVDDVRAFAQACANAASGTLFIDSVGDLSADLQAKLAKRLEAPKDLRIMVGALHDRQIGRELIERIGVLRLMVPSLHERGEDVLLLAAHFLSSLAPERKKVTFAEEAKAALRRHLFSGNLRELRNAMARALVASDGGIIRVEDLALVSPPSSSLSALEREAIVRAVRHANGSMNTAAKQLKIARSTLYRKLDEHGITDDELSG